jgi:5-formyltetrahydrofolate cyclo-ligase
MAPTIPDTKAALRREVRRILKTIPANKREAAAGHARALLKNQAIWRAARTILFFAPLEDELDVWPLMTEALTAGKAAALPRFDAKAGGYLACHVHNLAGDLRTGQFGIREPGTHCQEIAINRLDLVLVPGVAFDLQGRRLGRGKGFYDRWLATMRGTTCGVAFDEQIVRRVPVAPHDAQVNCILTPTRWIELRERAVLE